MKTPPKSPPLADAASPRRFFDAIAARYDRAYALRGDASRERMSRVLAQLAPRSRVLDLGVGTGRELAALLDAGHAPTGVDVSEAMIAQCHRRTRPVPLVMADFFDSLPFDDATFDAAIALHGSLAHPPNDGAIGKLAAELARVLVAGGSIVAELPAAAYLAAAETPAFNANDEFRLTRISATRCLHEDRATGVSVEVWIPPAEVWLGAFSAHFQVELEPLGPYEWFLRGRSRCKESA